MIWGDKLEVRLISRMNYISRSQSLSLVTQAVHVEIASQKSTGWLGRGVSLLPMKWH